MPEEAIGAWERLLLLHLIAEGGAGPWGGIPSSSITRAHRQRLERAGLLEVTRGARNALQLELTDAGWAWVHDHLEGELPSTKAAAPVLMAWLAQVRRFLAERRVGLAEVFLAEGPAADDERGRSPDPGPLEDRVVAAYLALSEGRWDRPVRIAALRSRLPEAAAGDVDAALRALARAGRADLLPLDDPRERTAADTAAALMITGHPHHLVYLSETAR